jgi:hypothetical protein
MGTTRRIEAERWPVPEYPGVEVAYVRAYGRWVAYRHGVRQPVRTQYNWWDVEGRRRAISLRGLVWLAWRAGAEIIPAWRLEEERAAVPHVYRFRTADDSLLAIPCSNYRVCFDDEGEPFVRSFARHAAGARALPLGGIMSPVAHAKDGRPMVTLADDNGRLCNYQLAYWALSVTAGPPPDRHHAWVLHGDGDQLNTRGENLRWGSAAENTADRIAHGRHNWVRAKEAA